MSASVEDNPELKAAVQPPPPPPGDQVLPPERTRRHAHRPHEHSPPEHHSHHVLIEAEEDRWEWRRKIRSKPRQLVVYRLVVGLVGLLLIALGLMTGPLPGPGGIPLVLLGLAVWSSEFEWAHKLMQRLKALLRRYTGWTRKQKVGFWAAFLAVCGTLGYLYMVAIGVPFWVPSFAEQYLERLPGV
jgi:uncharacterized protein (TIGR02611 family)